MKVIKRAVQAGLVAGLMGTAAFAQNLGDAKKAIDAEQYQQAKTILKKLIAAQASAGENYFYLGNVYLKTDYADSAKATYTKGVSADNEYPLNYVGLGTVDLLAKNGTSAKTNFDKAISLAKKKDDSPYLYIGKAYTLVGDYATAVTSLEKAKSINEKDAEVYLALGDAYRGDKKNSEAFSAYRTAFDMDNTLFRAKIEQGKSVRLSKAFQESANEFNAIIASNPNYAPAYRELAETYYQWAVDNKYEEAKLKQALQYYGKYMDLTDRSLDSRMRYADFLYLAREYSALEQEAQKMASQAQTNPRIYRYLGYSALENGHYAESVKALKEFIAKVEPTRVIALDYLNLGKAQLKMDDTSGVSALAKAVQMDSSYAEPLSELGKEQFTAKKYDLAAKLYDLAVANPESKTLVYDYFYLGMADYFAYATKDAEAQKTSKDLLVRADSAFSYVAQKSPTTPDSYLYRARINRLLDDDQNSKGLMVPFYEKYLEILAAKEGAMADPRYKNPIVESYNNLGAYYINSNQAKAKEYFNKSLALDPTNTYASDVLKSISGK